MSELSKEELEQPVREKFVVDNDMKAEWCLSKIRSAKKEAERQIEELTRQMEFYRCRIESIKLDCEEEIQFFKDMLAPYFESRVDKEFVKKTKTQVSYQLPTGKLVLKHREPDFEYKEHQPDAIAWLKKNNGEKYIKVKEELDWKALKTTVTVSGNVVCTKDGEVIPGIVVTPREDVFEVEVS